MSMISDRCNSKLCGAVCCTFLTFSYDRKLEDDFKGFLSLHGIEIKEEFVTKFHRRFLRTYLKLPVPCMMFDQSSMSCKIYATRPRHCRVNPTKESPFIPGTLCSVLHPELNTVVKKDDGQ